MVLKFVVKGAKNRDRKHLEIVLKIELNCAEK